MKILSITAQKPDSTGSGVYLKELVNGFAALGCKQAVIAGIYKEDMITFPEDVQFYPVYFKTESLPFAIAGMSDEMPYESTVYSQMTEDMTEVFKRAFLERIKEACNEFEPDIILCHHLYLVTALVRAAWPEKRVYGFCHNTDLRQMRKNPLLRDFIREHIRQLNGIFAIHEEQKKQIVEVYDVPEERIGMAGTGYNNRIFFKNRTPSDNPVSLIFAGKLSEKKGAMSLIRSLSYLSFPKDSLVLKMAGGYGNREEYEEIKRLALLCPYPVQFLGKLSQPELAKEYNACDVFVLPSFFEGVPLTVIEAIACGDKVVVTDLPGLREWIESKILKAPVTYVTPPDMHNTDEPVPEALHGFERDLAQKIEQSISAAAGEVPDLTNLSWENICRTVMGEIGKLHDK